jgi:Arc/MetJ family transcription regulator
MRSTLDIPDDLVEEAKRLTGLRTKREVVVLALDELVRRIRVERFRALLGKIDYDLTQEQLEGMRGED